MKIKFDGMNGKEKNLYEEMWSDFDFSTMSVEVRRTKGSSNSYCFVGESDKKQLLAKAFDIENIDLFSEKYDMVTSGSGDEEQKITILRSSSLFAISLTTNFLRFFLKKIFNSISLFLGRPNLS